MNEKNIRKFLNYGHTLGHAIESHLLGSDRELLHGEAIAIGIILETYLSSLKTGFDSSIKAFSSTTASIFLYTPVELVKMSCLSD